MLSFLSLALGSIFGDQSASLGKDIQNGRVILSSPGDLPKIGKERAIARIPLGNGTERLSSFWDPLCVSIPGKALSLPDLEHSFFFYRESQNARLFHSENVAGLWNKTSFGAAHVILISARRRTFQESFGTDLEQKVSHECTGEQIMEQKFGTGDGKGILEKDAKGTPRTSTIG